MFPNKVFIYVEKANTNMGDMWAQNAACICLRHEPIYLKLSKVQLLEKYFLMELIKVQVTINIKY